MSGALPPFLAALGVDDPAADERTLRRAYAKRLKQIDIEADPAAFQALRENLEAALSWAAWQMRQRAQAAQVPREAVPVPVSEAPPGPAVAGPDVVAVVGAQPPEPRPAVTAPPASVRPPTAATEPAPQLAPAAPPAFLALGDAVFADLQRGLAADLPDMPRAAMLLSEAFADPRLVNIDARLVVEGRIAALVASGWRPGHENLLDAAVRAFDWESDHARLAPFGQAGGAIAAALRERVALERLAPHQRTSLQVLLAELRRRHAQDDARPAVDMRTLRAEILYLKLLTERFPTWTRLVAPIRVVGARIEQWNALPPAVRATNTGSTALTSDSWSAPPTGNKDDRRLLRVLLGGAVALAGTMKLLALAQLPQPTSASTPGRHAGAPPAAYAPADDADLARRQQNAEALLRQALAASAPAR